VKIALVVTGRGYSFTNQARALQAALQTVGVTVELSLLSASDTLNPSPDIDLIMPVGAWQDYDDIIAPALATGIPTLPWIVADIVADGEPTIIDRDINSKLCELPIFLTTSEYCKNNFIQNGIPGEKIGVLFECVNEDLWKPYNETELQNFLEFISIDEETKTALPLHFNLRRAKAEGIPILYTTGGSATGKGALEILNALGQINPAKEWLYIIKTWPSTGSYANSIIEMQTASQNHISSKLRYISGEFADKFLIGLMNVCDIYVATSRSEGFGLPLVEAQLCGKMVVTHNATATAETVIDGVTGLVAQAHIQPNCEAMADIPDLTQKLERAIDDQALRAQLSGQARQSAIDRFGKQAIGQKCVVTIQSALAVINQTR